MLRVRLPGTDLTVSALCLGTAQLGTRISEVESYRLLDAFVDQGGNFLDTALNYADWATSEASVSEKVIGRWLRTRTDADTIVVATKGACPRPDRFLRLTPDCLHADVTDSLRNLQVSSIPLYWLHRDDPSVPVEVIIDTLNDLVTAGYVRHLGCSNWTTARIRAAQAYAAANGLHGFVASQMRWSLAVSPEPDDPTLVAMDAESYADHLSSGLAAIPYSAQARGLFSGRYRPDSPPATDSAAAAYWTETSAARLDHVLTVAARLDEPPAAVALALLRAQPFPVVPIFAVNSIEQLLQSCRGGHMSLPWPVSDGTGVWDRP